MLVKSIRMQLYEMLRKKTVVFTYFILFIFVMANFFSNVFFNADVQYISQMYDPIKTLTLSDWSMYGYFFTQYFPLLVVIPTSCAYLTDRNTMVKIYIQSRVGSTAYWYGKLISVFLTTFLVFTIPFFIEIGLSAICFSVTSLGDPSNIEYFQLLEQESVYFLSELFFYNRFLYAIIMTFLFGIVSAILATFNFSLTCLPVFTYKIFTFFPIYILFYCISTLETFLKPSFTLNYFFILRMFDTSEKNYYVYGIFLAIIFCISIVLIGVKAKKDDSL